VNVSVSVSEREGKRERVCVRERLVRLVTRTKERVWVGLRVFSVRVSNKDKKRHTHTETVVRLATGGGSDLLCFSTTMHEPGGLLEGGRGDVGV
jgi:hypothetical protein